MPNYKVVDSDKLDSDLAVVANAIREKVNTADTLHFPDGYSDTIEAIPTGGGVEDGVNFYDYDGTLLYSYTVEQAQRLTELPPLPKHDGLVCQGWNWNLADIKAHNRAVDVGAMYTTDDGTTRIYITLTEGRTSPMLGVYPNGTVTVDWGDGTDPDVLTGTSTSTVKWTPIHNYASVGNYVIRLTVEGSMKIMGSSYGSRILRGSTREDITSYPYLHTVRKVEIGQSVIIGDYAFYQCSNLVSLNIPNGITTISGCAFHSCNALTSAVVPNSVTTIGGSVFYDCNHLAPVSIPNSVISIGASTFTFCYALKSIVIPNSVASLGVSLFRRCYGLKSIIIPDGITAIGDEMFKYCHSLQSISIPDSVTSIGAYAFNQCYNLGSIIIPSGVKDIGGYAFSECSNLGSVTIQGIVYNIGVPMNGFNGGYTFSTCSKLVFFRCLGNIGRIYEGTFTPCNNLLFYDFTGCTSVPALNSANAIYIASTTEIRVPSGLYAKWINATNWTAFADYIVAV